MRRGNDGASMAVTDEQVAALRAQLAGDTAEYRRRIADLDTAADRDGYTALLSAAFVVAAERRFSVGSEVGDVLKFVADVRGRTPDAGDDIDARTAERLILAAVSDADIDDIDTDTAILTQLMLLAALTADAQYDDAGLDAFLVEARALADEWTS
jgi:hypothetical protein